MVRLAQFLFGHAFTRWFFVLMLSTSAAGCASLPANVQRTRSSAFAAPETTALGQLVQARRTQAGARSESGFRLLESVDAAFTSRLALAQRAQRSLDLQYYAVHADASTEVLLQAVREAALRGVKVRVLLDDFNTVGDDAQVLRLAFVPNVEMRLFNPLPGSRGSLVGRVLGSLHDIRHLQKRMHNKLFIADNAWGITGGRNLGDRYFGSGEKNNFVDLDVLAAGRIVRDMSSSFDRYWNDELAYPVQSLLTPEDLDRLRKPEDRPLPAAGVLPVSVSPTVLPNVTPSLVAQAERPAMDLATTKLTWAPAVLMVDKPDKVAPGDEEADAGETVVDGLLNLMRAAQKDVLVVSPYFVPGKAMMEEFEALRKRGVRVRVLTNSLASNDAPAAHAGYVRYRKDLLAMGVELYEMRADPQTAPGLGSGIGSGSRSLAGSGPGGSKAAASRASLHSKAVVIDGRLSVIGSMNLDLRSQIQNSEVALVIRSVALSREATAQVEDTFARGAYRVELLPGGMLRWRAPPGADFQDARTEPDAGAKLRLLVQILGPIAPEEML